MALIAQELLSDPQIDESQDLARLFKLDKLGLDTSPVSMNYLQIFEGEFYALPEGLYPTRV